VQSSMSADASDGPVAQGPTRTATLRVGVGLATLLGCACFGVASAALGHGPERGDAGRVVRLALVFAGVVMALAPVIANGVRPGRAGWPRVRAAGFWVVLFPLITMFPLALTFDGGLAQVIHYATYGLWLAGATSGVGFAAVYAQRTAFALPPSRWRTRWLWGAGVLMTAVTVSFLVPASIFVLGLVSAGLFARGTPPPEYVFPESFSGTATLIYPDPSAPPGKRSGKGRVYEFPASGTLRMRDVVVGAQPMPRFFFVDSAGLRRPIPRGSESECAPVIRRPLAAAHRVHRDIVCEHYRGFDGERYQEDFIVVRAPKSATP